MTRSIHVRLTFLPTYKMPVKFMQCLTIDEKYRDYLDLTPLMIVVGCCSVAIVVCTAAMAFEFTNTYRVVESWLLGPSTVYLITLITGQ